MSSHESNARVVVCGAGTVVKSHYRAAPYTVVGCMVGEPESRDGRDYLVGMAFVTRIDREDGRWPRDEAPSPCPYCGYEGK